MIADYLESAQQAYERRFNGIDYHDGKDRLVEWQAQTAALIAIATSLKQLNENLVYLLAESRVPNEEME